MTKLTNTSPSFIAVCLAISVLGSACDDRRPEPANEPAGQERPASNKDLSPRGTAHLFDGDRAFDQLLSVVEFGPRNANSAGHQQTMTYISTTLQALADTVWLQPFTHSGYDGKILKLSNIIASFDPANPDRILLCTHWDSRPRADRDPDPSRWEEPILGANDGGSGVAVLLELARIFNHHRPRIGVDLIFFDGEDYGYEGDTQNYLLGSRHFARTKPSDYAPRFGILIDMIGDARLEIMKEGHSMSYAPEIVELVWDHAEALGYQQFVSLHGEPITDDHLPLNEVGIKTIDLIDLAYPDATNHYWHTHQDTPDKCSPESLEAVGRVLAEVVFSQ